MAHSETAASKQPAILPPSVVGPADISRLVRELDTIDGALLDHTLRKQGGEAKMLKTSRLMDQLVEANGLNLLQKTDRQQLQTFLQAVKDRAPVLHMSFSADPSPTFLDKLTAWLRREIHPQVLLSIGLQPTIGAGCVVRSTNHYFDFSLRQDFAKKRELLLQQLAAPPTRETAQ